MYNDTYFILVGGAPERDELKYGERNVKRCEVQISRKVTCNVLHCNLKLDLPVIIKTFSSAVRKRRNKDESRGLGEGRAMTLKLNGRNEVRRTRDNFFRSSFFIAGKTSAERKKSKNKNFAICEKRR
ncbi:hypothetical protein CEXT_60781 [Caerostris extrusa]|uniref:Uncharacterized protein n=1 Tax=Caerostris extrusa TaxID=172846 RepID=A0AAV4XEA5_CAEEX|nr:hypothetical protein CEXT_60781 [Caerostris extrusa]